MRFPLWRWTRNTCCDRYPTDLFLDAVKGHCKEEPAQRGNRQHPVRNDLNIDLAACFKLDRFLSGVHFAEPFRQRSAYAFCRRFRDHANHAAHRPDLQLGP